MTAAKVVRFLFEGQDRPISEIQAMVPALSKKTIRKHLAEGRNTRQAMLAYSPVEAMRNAARLGGKAVRYGRGLKTTPQRTP